MGEMTMTAEIVTETVEAAATVAALVGAAAGAAHAPRGAAAAGAALRRTRRCAGAALDPGHELTQLARYILQRSIVTSPKSPLITNDTDKIFRAKITIYKNLFDFRIGHSYFSLPSIYIAFVY